MPILNDVNANGYVLTGLKRINILLGKNGCGKSTLLRRIEQSLGENQPQQYKISYITPERGGVLKEDVGEEQALINTANRMNNTRRQNQLVQFKQQTIFSYRRLKELVQDEIELNPAIRLDASITFNSYLEKINSLLDNIRIVRDATRRSFVIQKKDDNATLEPEQISSGESELIALGIECLAFVKALAATKSNLIFLDEPDVHLHPDLQSRLIAFIEKLILENPNFQIIIATHSTAVLGAISENPFASIAFMKPRDVNVSFRPISEHHKRILPIFGAHPLSEIFSARPPLLVEGEDDVRIWQQATRTSLGKVKIYPVSTDTIARLNVYEVEVDEIISSVYDTAIGYSLRDRDEAPYEIADQGKVVRCRLSCRNAENLIVSTEVLAILGVDWPALQATIIAWIGDPINETRSDYGVLVAFRDGGFQRKSFDLKQVRNVLIYLCGSSKPWEVAVGQAIGQLTWNDQTNFQAQDTLIDFLGEKLVRAIVPKNA